jgi:hypothetical protein
MRAAYCGAHIEPFLRETYNTSSTVKSGIRPSEATHNKMGHRGRVAFVLGCSGGMPDIQEPYRLPSHPREDAAIPLRRGSACLYQYLESCFGSMSGSPVFRAAKKPSQPQCFQAFPVDFWAVNHYNNPV